MIGNLILRKYFFLFMILPDEKEYIIQQEELKKQKSLFIKKWEDDLELFKKTECNHYERFFCFLEIIIIFFRQYYTIKKENLIKRHELEQNLILKHQEEQKNFEDSFFQYFYQSFQQKHNKLNTLLEFYQLYVDKSFFEVKRFY